MPAGMVMVESVSCYRRASCDILLQVGPPERREPSGTEPSTGPYSNPFSKSERPVLTASRKGWMRKQMSSAPRGITRFMGEFAFSSCHRKPGNL